jgi:xylulokinase
VYGVPVSTVDREEGPAYGAALLAAVGAGAYPDLAAAARATLTRAARERPDPEAHRAYDAPYARFRALAPSARPPAAPSPAAPSPAAPSPAAPSPAAP